MPRERQEEKTGVPVGGIGHHDYFDRDGALLVSRGGADDDGDGVSGFWVREAYDDYGEGGVWVYGMREEPGGYGVGMCGRGDSEGGLG